MTEQEKWLELADLYSVGALEGRELAEFEARLKSGCEICGGRLKENQAALGGVLKNVALLSPDAALKARIMEALGEEEPVLVGQGVSIPVWAAAGFWALLSAAVIFGWNTTSGKRHAMEFKRMETMMMAEAGARAVDLKPLNQPGPVTAKMIWNAKGDCVLMTMGLPKHAREKAYELWGLKGDKPVAVGTFTVDEHGCAVFSTKNFKAETFDKFAVTLEPAGGVPAPTGPMVLLS